MFPDRVMIPREGAMELMVPCARLFLAEKETVGEQIGSKAVRSKMEVKGMAPFEQLAPLPLEQADDDLSVAPFSWRQYGTRKASLKDRETRIRERAYLLWEGAGRPVGEQDMHWLMAVEEIDAEIKAAKARH